MPGLEQKLVAEAADFAKGVGTFFVGTTQEIKERVLLMEGWGAAYGLSTIGELAILSIAISNALPGEVTTSFLRHITFANLYAAPFAVDGGVRLVRTVNMLLRCSEGFPQTGAIGTLKEIFPPVASYAAQFAGRAMRYFRGESPS